MASYLFSSESVTEGHPDKLCDAVSDSVLDACLAADPYSRVACETVAKTGFVLVAGEITTKAQLDYQKIVRTAVREIGFTSSDMCFDATTCAVMIAVEHQSPDIAQGVDRGDPAEAGRGRSRPDVRLRLQRDQGADATADPDRAPTRVQARAGPEEPDQGRQLAPSRR